MERKLTHLNKRNPRVLSKEQASISFFFLWLALEYCHLTEQNVALLDSSESLSGKWKLWAQGHCINWVTGKTWDLGTQTPYRHGVLTAVTVPHFSQQHTPWVSYRISKSHEITFLHCIYFDFFVLGGLGSTWCLKIWDRFCLVCLSSWFGILVF